MSLERFRTAQDAAHAGFATALAELRTGRKTSHWIWYVFPQLAGLGRSSTAQFYAIRDVAEAAEYLRDPVLRGRLTEATEVVAAQLGRGVELVALMGGTIDSVKLVSSLTLFQAAARKLAATETGAALPAFIDTCDRILAAAEAQGFPRCRFTLQQVGAD